MSDPVRRVVTGNDASGTHSQRVQDGPCPDARTDPARPGFSVARIWVTDRTPVVVDGVSETLDFPHTLEPPADGSVCRIVTLPPDSTWRASVGRDDVAAYFSAMGSAGASAWSPGPPHPYMQRTRSLDFVVVLDGEITLVLDTEE